MSLLNDCLLMHCDDLLIAYKNALAYTCFQFCCVLSLAFESILRNKLNLSLFISQLFSNIVDISGDSDTLVISYLSRKSY